MRFVTCALIGACLLLGACADHNKEAKRLAQAPTVRYMSDGGPRQQMMGNVESDSTTPSKPAPTYQQVQTRIFESGDEAALMTAAAKTLEAQGFEVDRTAASIGVLTAKLRKDASTGNQIAQALIIALLVGPGGGPLATANTTHAMVLATRGPAPGETEVRVWYDVIITRKGEKYDYPVRVSKPETYTQFFTNMSDAAAVKVKS